MRSLIIRIGMRSGAEDKLRQMSRLLKWALILATSDGRPSVRRKTEVPARAGFRQPEDLAKRPIRPHRSSKQSDPFARHFVEAVHLFLQDSCRRSRRHRVDHLLQQSLGRFEKASSLSSPTRERFRQAAETKVSDRSMSYHRRWSSRTHHAGPRCSRPAPGYPKRRTLPGIGKVTMVIEGTPGTCTCVERSTEIQHRQHGEDVVC